MKNAEFQALTVYTSKSAVDGLSAGTKFLWGAAGTGPATNIHGKQQGNTALRHRITYYVKLADGTNRMVYDILEADTTTQQTKTATRRGKSRVATRDDDNSRDIISSTDWS